jgi:uncharacterized protein YciI
MAEKHFLLFYEYAPDYLERRPALRPSHFKHAQESIGRDELQLGGAFADPPDGGALLFKALSRDAVEAFARADPYVTNGLVTSWRVREWTTVVGPGALTRVTS